MQNLKKLLFALLLSSCAQKQSSQELTKFEQVPPELFLMPKTNITTQYGQYISGSEVEIWHSHKQFTDLQDEISKFRPIQPSK